jgi:hypothetical protein
MPLSFPWEEEGRGEGCAEEDHGVVSPVGPALNDFSFRSQSSHHLRLLASEGEEVQAMTEILAILTALVGIILAVTPWLLRFTADRVARTDVLIGGLVVAAPGLLTYEPLVYARARRTQH